MYLFLYTRFTYNYFLFQLQELEMENSKIKSDLTALRKHIADSTIPDKAAADELMSKLIYHKQLKLLIIGVEIALKKN